MILPKEVDKPAAPTDAIRKRWHVQSMYRRQLESEHEPDVQTELSGRFDPRRRASWGKPVLGMNLFKSAMGQIGTALYDQTPEVTVEGGEAFQQALKTAGLWSLMQGFGVDLCGVNEHAMRVDYDGGLVFRPVYADYLIAYGSPRRPEVPHTIGELQQRTYNDGQKTVTVWVWEQLSVQDPQNPIHRIVKADGKAWTNTPTDMSDIFKEGGSGDKYQYRNSRDEPFLPYVIYHREKRARMWSERRNLELARGNLEAIVLWSLWFHVAVDASWPQRAVCGMVPRSRLVKNPGTQQQAEVVDTDPASIMLFDYTNDEGADSKAPMQWQWQPAGDLLEMEEAISRFCSRLAAQLQIPASDIQRTSSGDARSGYAISISNSGLRAVQRRMEPQIRQGDLQLLAVAAAVANRATAGTPGATRYPETGHTITYPAIPRSSEEKKDDRDEEDHQIKHGLKSRVQAYMERHGVSREQAIAALRQIEEDNRLFPPTLTT